MNFFTTRTIKYYVMWVILLSSPYARVQAISLGQVWDSLVSFFGKAGESGEKELEALAEMSALEAKRVASRINEIVLLSGEKSIAAVNQLIDALLPAFGNDLGKAVEAAYGAVKMVKNATTESLLKTSRELESSCIKLQEGVRVQEKLVNDLTAQLQQELEKINAPATLEAVQKADAALREAQSFLNPQLPWEASEIEQQAAQLIAEKNVAALRAQYENVALSVEQSMKLVEDLTVMLNQETEKLTGEQQKLALKTKELLGTQSQVNDLLKHAVDSLGATLTPQQLTDIKATLARVAIADSSRIERVGQRFGYDVFIQSDEAFAKFLERLGGLSAHESEQIVKQLEKQLSAFSGFGYVIADYLERALNQQSPEIERRVRQLAGVWQLAPAQEQKFVDDVFKVLSASMIAAASDSTDQIMREMRALGQEVAQGRTDVALQVAIGVSGIMFGAIMLGAGIEEEHAHRTATGS